MSGVPGHSKQEPDRRITQGNAAIGDSTGVCSMNSRALVKTFPLRSRSHLRMELKAGWDGWLQTRTTPPKEAPEGPTAEPNVLGQASRQARPSRLVKQGEWSSTV